MKSIANILELKEAIKKEDILITLYGAQNCGPCRSVKEKLDAYLASHQDIKGLYIQTEKYIQYCASNSIFMVPTIIVYVKGKETIKKIRNFSLFEIFDQIKRYQELIK